MGGCPCVLASNYPGKLAELDTLLVPLGVELVVQGRLGIDEASESHPTFLETAFAKAVWAPLDADLAARLAGDREALRRARDAADNRLLLKRLESCSDRCAAHVATLVAIRHGHRGRAAAAMRDRSHERWGPAPGGSTDMAGAFEPHT